MKEYWNKNIFDDSGMNKDCAIIPIVEKSWEALLNKNKIKKIPRVNKPMDISVDLLIGEDKNGPKDTKRKRGRPIGSGNKKDVKNSITNDLPKFYLSFRSSMDSSA